MKEGKVRILVDSWCAGFGGHGWYETSSFGDDVAKALIADRYFEYMKLWEAPVKAKKE